MIWTHVTTSFQAKQRWLPSRANSGHRHHQTDLRHGHPHGPLPNSWGTLSPAVFPLKDLPVPNQTSGSGKWLAAFKIFKGFCNARSSPEGLVRWCSVQCKTQSALNIKMNCKTKPHLVFLFSVALGNLCRIQEVLSLLFPLFQSFFFFLSLIK